MQNLTVQQRLLIAFALVLLILLVPISVAYTGLDAIERQLAVGLSGLALAALGSLTTKIRPCTRSRDTLAVRRHASNSLADRLLVGSWRSQPWPLDLAAARAAGGVAQCLGAAARSLRRAMPKLRLLGRSGRTGDTGLALNAGLGHGHRAEDGATLVHGLLPFQLRH